MCQMALLHKDFFWNVFFFKFILILFAEVCLCIDRWIGIVVL